MIPENVFKKYGLTNSFSCLEEEIRLYKNFLDVTDYEIIKSLENGTPIRDDIKEYRQFARDEINKIGEIDE